MENRITTLFREKSHDVLNVYFTAGHPTLNSTSEIIRLLDNAGADLVEVGIPYSDPLADGTTIQQSSMDALKNGMTLDRLFAQVEEARRHTDIPIILMGYFNQMLQYGPEEFIKDAKSSGADGLIIPDLPMDIYSQSYRSLFEKYQLSVSFLITPQTSDARVRLADELSSGFIYMVSKSSITGGAGEISEEQLAYFERIKQLNLKTPRLIGFGIHNKATYETAAQHGNGVIIGSAFIRAIDQCIDLEEAIFAFMHSIRSDVS